MKKHKYIFVIGGVMSGVGKGIASASIGKILQARGFSINPIKIDPYLNVDAGTMNPVEHGEVFVLSSGLECDQDMGNYERFMNIELHPENYMTNGMVFKTVIDRERNLGYGGKCVEPVFHISEEIHRRIAAAVKKTDADITILEIGGTAGEYQNAIFIEAARTMKLKNPDDVIFVLVSYLPVPGTIGEMKTKPTQNAVRTLNSYGVHPDVIIARSDRALDQRRKMKIADFVSIPVEHIISAPDVENIYDVPINFEKDGLSECILQRLHLQSKKESNLDSWKRMLTRAKNAKETVRIAMVGKYFKTGDFVLSDVYISIIESLKHAAYALSKKVKIDWISSLEYEEDEAKIPELAQYDGVLVPGGFGGSGVAGKLKTIRFVREQKIPYFGICYGMQLALVEYARDVMNFTDANTTEVNKKTSYPVIDIMPEQVANLENKKYGGTMRLGSYPAILKKGTLAYRAYSQRPEGRWAFDKATNIIHERHRHRYEVNPLYVSQFEQAGILFSGVSPDGKLMEIMELPQAVHPFFLGTQYHPEFTGSPLNPQPLFVEFFKACIDQKEQRESLSEEEEKEQEHTQ